MATKTYRAIGSIVNISVIVDGREIDIDFFPVSNYEAGRGGSRFVTNNKKIQDALERRFDFGMLFYLEKDEQKEYDENGAVISCTLEEEAAEEKKLETVKVDSIQSAKTYLVEHYGWKPAGRISIAKITEAAEGYGVAFEGLN